MVNTPKNEAPPSSDHSVMWSPPRELIESCALNRFSQKLSTDFGLGKLSYKELHAWSIANPAEFWAAACTFLDIKGTGSLTPVFGSNAGPTPLARTWFPNFSLNFAENLLRGEDHQTAIISWTEDRLKRTISFGELKERVAQIAQYLSRSGVKAGDRVFAYLPNIPEAVICMLAAASLGATWSSCGTDYLIEGLLSRIERVQPTVLIASTSFLWRGKESPLTTTIEEVINKSPSIKHILLVDYLSDSSHTPQVASAAVTPASYRTLIEKTSSTLAFTPLPFSHPLYIMFSSGTTGKPKGIVHSAGGTLLEHKKEHMLHGDLRAGDRLFYQTSTSWMMWNWLVSGLACEATIVMYDGDPMSHNGSILWELIAQEHVTHFGTSAAYLGELEKRGVHPGKISKLDRLRAIFSTGSTLYPSQFDFVMQSIKHLWLQSISGGTDIIGCFGLGCPLLPVRRGEVQCKSLGYDVRVFNSEAKDVISEQGELVCTSPAPSMPVYFLDDREGIDYRKAYFADFPGVWRHGDFVEETSEGSLIFGGRSDATLKPGGVRVATADIYAALSRVPEVQGALAVGYTPNGASSEKIVLFVVLPDGTELSEPLKERIRSELKRSNAFYVPALTLAAPELPRTTNNKLAELSVRRILQQQDPGNRSALANPRSLDFFENVALPEVVRILG